MSRSTIIAATLVLVATSGPLAGPDEGALAALVQGLCLDDDRCDEALDVAREALADAERIHGAWTRPAAQALYLAGWVRLKTHDVAGARVDFERALAIAERVHGPEHAELEVYLREYGVALHDLERFGEAADVFERAVRIVRSEYGSGHEKTLRAVINLAIARKTLGALAASERLYDEAIGILERQPDPDPESLAWALDSRAGLLFTQGLLRESLDAARRAHELRIADAGPESALAARSLNNVARHALALGDYLEARSLLDEALRIARATDAGPALELRILKGLAVAARELGDLERARALLDSVPEHVPAGTIDAGYHHDLAIVLARLGESRTARTHFARALGRYESTLGVDDYHAARVHLDLAELELDGGSLDGAREHAARAVAILERLVIADHRDLTRALAVLASLDLVAGRRTEAIERALDADARRRRLAATTLAVLPERQALAQAALPRRGLDVALSAVLAGETARESRDAVFDAVVRGRALAFDEIASRRRGYGQSEELERLRRARARLAAAHLGEPWADLDRLRREVESIESSLAHGAGRTSTRDDPGADEVVAALPADASLVSFVRYTRHAGRSRSEAYAAIVVGPGDTGPVFVDLGEADLVDRRVGQWRDRMRSELIVGTVGEDLRRRIWDPLREAVGDAGLVLVAPDGLVNLVSFAALPIAEHRFVIDTGPAFHYLTAERDVVASAATGERRGAGVLLVGDPSFDLRIASAGGVRSGADGCRAYGSMRFGPLPGAAREVRAVESIWREATGTSTSGGGLRLSGAEATERAVRRHAPGKRIIHLATHGFFLGDGCSAGGEGVRGVGGLAPRESVAAPLSPLLLSGVVLAGANRRADGLDAVDDGLLTAEEIAVLDLSGTELAVLSACRTGDGSVSEGEGVFGLRRAFLTAGVEAVVTNLWDVEDRSAERWMRALYRGLLIEGLDLPRAMQAAGREVLAARRKAKRSTHPFFWGGWLAVGRPD